MKNYSVAIFGSTLRNDYDKYSDKDLLIVADSYKELDALKNKYSKDNWSISFYTYSKLEYLSKSGNLFIKHLQKESEILIDVDNKLDSILKGFKEKSNYKCDIKSSIKYFEILKYVPNTQLGYAWYCDCLYVGLRNYLVFVNAKNGVFEFSFNKLLSILNKKRKINIDDISLLKELRVIKRNYRENILTELPSSEFIQKLILVFKKLNISSSTSLIESKEFQTKVEEKILRNNSPLQVLIFDRG